MRVARIGLAIAWSGLVAPVFWARPALALMASAGQPGVRHWEPGATVHDIAQTTDGYLWFGTDTGLKRGDGARFIGVSDDANRW